jgi:hypothetical protein
MTQLDTRPSTADGGTPRGGRLLGQLRPFPADPFGYLEQLGFGCKTSVHSGGVPDAGGTDWRVRYGAGWIDRLDRCLAHLIADSEALAAGLIPYNEGWWAPRPLSGADAAFPRVPGAALPWSRWPPLAADSAELYAQRWQIELVYVPDLACARCGCRPSEFHDPIEGLITAVPPTRADRCGHRRRRTRAALVRHRHPTRPDRWHQRPDPAPQLRSGRGHVNRVKMLKRTMFGRANFDVLRKRILLTA